MMASRAGHTHVAGYLLKMGADVDALDTVGRSS